MPDATARQVLYVEDDRINIILMEEALRHVPGWTLVVAEDGAHALQRLQAGFEPALVLIDMHLPDMSGLDLMTRIRSDERLGALRCVAMSADDPAPMVKAALAAGFEDYWLKPVNPKRFEAFA